MTHWDFKAFLFETMTKCLEIRSCFPEVDHLRNP